MGVRCCRSSPGAADIWTNDLPAYVDRLGNTPMAAPHKGDIILWQRAGGFPDGHVAIFIWRWVFLDAERDLEGSTPTRAIGIVVEAGALRGQPSSNAAPDQSATTLSTGDAEIFSV